MWRSSHLQKASERASIQNSRISTLRRAIKVWFEYINQRKELRINYMLTARRHNLRIKAKFYHLMQKCYDEALVDRTIVKQRTESAEKFESFV